jgi:exopolysaccharide production protein ExoZ
MKTERFWGIQYLRAIAALMVVCVHFIITFRPDLGGPTAWTLTRGVTLFFVISGFVMMVTGAHLSGGEFIRRRLVRIVPLYWILTSVIAVRAILAPNLFKSVVMTWPYFIKSLLFIPFANPSVSDQLKPILVPGWTLNYEMFFYALFALLLLTARNRIILYTGLVFVGLNLVRWVWEPESFYGSPIVFEFLAGMLIGRYCRLFTLPWIASAMLIASGFALLFQPWGEYEGMLSAALIVLGAVKLEPYIPKIAAFALLGDASYSIYLLHLFVFSVTRLLWHGAGFFVFSLICVIGASILSYRYIERPMAKLFQKRRPARFECLYVSL